MNAASQGRAAGSPARGTRFHLWRTRRDRLARWSIALGGIAVIAAVGLIFFYLVYAVFPLFRPATIEIAAAPGRAEWAGGAPLYLAVEEQLSLGARIGAERKVEFFEIATGRIVHEELVPGRAGAALVRVAESNEHQGLLAAGDTEGNVHLLRLSYETRFEGGVEGKRIEPRLEYPFGQGPLPGLGHSPPIDLALTEAGPRLALAALGADGRVYVLAGEVSENPLTGERSLDSSVRILQPDFAASQVELSSNQDWMYLAGTDEVLRQYSLSRLQLHQAVPLDGGAVTALGMLLGGISVLAGDESGQITQLFPVRSGDNRYSLQVIRRFRLAAAPIRQIITEQRRKGFLASDAQQNIGVFHSTAGRRVLLRSLAGSSPQALALAPRANALLIEGGEGTLELANIGNPHPEVSLSALWRKTFYENYAQPAFIWQSSAATTEFEPKFSLTPLVFGTLKAALYAMLFAVPLALLAAAYTAFFMAPRLRNIVKPGIEIMAALPTVILGFLAGLWFAPFVEEHLAGLFATLFILPTGVLVFGWWWRRAPPLLRNRVPAGCEPVLLLPVLAILTLAAFGVAAPLESLILGQDLRDWLTNVAGIDYDQRNALVVGVAMGFAVVPTIFSIAEDAIYGVPASLSNGSLALGATPWQSLVRVVIPTASPGIFSALMIGFGRAVGETMIVLMATGNTPLMDWNLFEGMRTLAANIAIEMAESEVGSTHYRVLFLAALVLFGFTFVVNTVAEVVRQRLRHRYSSL